MRMCEALLLGVIVGCLAVAVAPRTVDFHWNRPQSEFLLHEAAPGGPLLLIDLEGAVRAGKTTPAASKLGQYATRYPGIHMGACRWTQDQLDAQVKPAWRDMARKMGLTLKWHPDEEYDEIVPYGSRVYLRALKASEETARYGKLAGLTLAVMWIDQPEECPEDVVKAYVPARLSQPGMPHEVWFTPNPPGEDAWLARMFPEDNSIAHHIYIHTSVYDNRHVLGDEYIASLEREYPAGTALRRRFIEGKRGLRVVGKPVYAGYFERGRHASQPVAINPDVPLIECIDFGHHHPCVLWQQYLPWGALHWLGGMMGEDMYIEDFAPLITQLRAEWFPTVKQLWPCSDPAGSHQNSQGTKLSGVKVLQDNGIYPRWVENSNMPEVRSGAIQQIAGYMRRRTIRGDEAFRVDPHRWRIISARDARFATFSLDALEAGYVWDERVRTSAAGKRIVVPLKDGYYEHVMNCAEYGQINYGPAKLTMTDEAKLQRQAEIAVTRRDKDPSDESRRGGQRVRPRGGW
jgi:PBSX family phage terminase large subunit